MFKYFKKHLYKMDYYKSLHSKRQTFKNKKTPTYSNTPQMTTQIQQPSNSILSTIKEGFAFGVGSSVAHNTVSRLFNSSSSTTDTKNTQCDIKLKDYEECVRQYRDNCNDLITEYEKCRRA
jgi:hypothetical protein